MNALRRLSFLALTLGCLAAGQSAAAQLTIYHLDVDQGDATLLVMPNGRTLLVDSGLDSKGSVIADFLRQLGVRRVDAFVLTHYDSDHMGGIDKVVAAGIPVDRWFDRGGKDQLPSSKRTSSYFREYDSVAVSPTRLDPGMAIALDSTVTINVVASNGQVRGAVGRYPFPPDENGYSIALLVSYEGFNCLVAGDLTRDVEARIVAEAAVGDLDVYHVNHHGSATSSSYVFLQAIRPEVAVISNGSRVDYNHPRQVVLDTLALVPGLVVYQTNKLLALVNRTSGDTVGGNVADSLIADLETTDADGVISIVVRSDGFEVRMPARGYARRYPIER